MKILCVAETFQVSSIEHLETVKNGNDSCFFFSLIQKYVINIISQGSSLFCLLSGSSVRLENIGYYGIQKKIL